MDNQNQKTNVIFPAGDTNSAAGSTSYGQPLSQPQSLEPTGVPLPQSAQSALSPPAKQEKLLIRIVKRADVVLALLLILGSGGLVLSTYVSKEPSSNSATGRYDTTQLPLNEFATSEGITFKAQSVIINGSLQANDGLIITPTLQPTSAVAGQMYYDQTSNVLSYYNGTQFVPVSSPTGGLVQSIAGLTGQINVGGGLSTAGGQLSNSGVLSIQGQTGNVTLNAGNGITIAGNTISNAGIVSITSSSPSLTVANDGNGNITLGGSGAGTVSSPGGTNGKIPVFTGAQTIADSILTQSGLTVTVAGDLAVVTGGLTLSNALTVSNGGTGATSLALNGVLIGQGTGAITSVTSGGPGLCLVSTAGAPTWAACPGGAGVDSLNGLAGALNIANASGAGNTITIDNASTTTKGIAQFDATNFTAGAGIVNTVQNINTGATPTFAGVNTNNITPSGALTVGSTSQVLTLQGNGGTTITATNGANTTTIGFVAPSANVTINFPALSAGTYDMCTTSGNCLGGGGGGANTALSNLSGVAINTTLLPGAAGGVHLGSGTLPFGDLFLAGTSGTPGTNNFRITGASTGGTRTITIPDASGTLCLTTGNCAGVGGGVTTAGGTIGTLPVFTGTQAIGDSLVSQSGGVVTVAGNLNLTAGNQYRINGTQISSADLSNDANLAKLNTSQTFTGNSNAFQNGSNSTNAFNVQNAAGTRLLTADTTNGEIELGTGSLMDGKLVFNNVSNNNTISIVPGTPTGNRTITLPDDSGIVCLNTGNCAGAGATLQTAYNFSVGGTTPKIKVNSGLGGVDIQDADTTIGANLLSVRGSNGGGLGSVMFGVASTGAITMQNINNSLTAMSVLTAGGTSVLTIDTTNGQTLLGQSGTLNGNLVFRNSTNANTITLTTAAATANHTATLPNATGEVCLNIGNCEGAGSTSTLQAAYDAGNIITTSTARDIDFNLADTATDANFLVDLECDTACGANGRFAVQDDGTDILTVAPTEITIGSATTNVPVSISSGTGSINIGNGAQARTVNVGTGAAAQTVTLGSSNTTSTTLIQGGSGNITLNSGGIIALQDTTTIAGNLTVTGTAPSALIVKASTAGTSAVVADFQQSDNDSIMRLTDTGTLGIGNTAGIAGIVALSSGTAFSELRATNVTAGRILQAPDVSGTLCTDAGNCGPTTGTLQNAYFYSAGGTTPEIKLDTIRNGIEIQDANTTIGSGQNFLSLRGPNAGGLGNVVVGFGTQGNLFMQPSTNRTDLVDINTNSTGNLFTVDSVNSRIGIALGSTNLPTHTLDVGGNTNLRGAGTGDSLTVSNATSTGNIALFKDNTTNVVTIADGGATTFQNSGNSAAAFRVLNATSVPQFVVDTSSSRVYIGNPTADGTGALLVLDTKNTPGDPDATGVDGGMYYNSSIGRLRCYEGNTWGECLGTPKPNTRRVTYFAAISHATEFMNGYGDILTHTSAFTPGFGAGSSSPPEVQYNTASSANAEAGLEGGDMYGLGSSAYAVFQTDMTLPSPITSERVWVGFTDLPRTTMADSATPTGDYVAFRYDTSAGDTTWKCITSNGGTTTIADSGISPTSMNGTMEIVVDHTTRAIFKIDDVIVCNITTNLPTTVARIINGITTLTAANRSLHIGWIYVESGYDGY